FEAEVPGFETNVWMGSELVEQGRFEGRSAEVRALDLALPWQDDGTASPREGRVTLSRRGKGRMYYRVALRWMPEPSTLVAHAAGITVERALRVASGPVAEGDLIGHGEMVALDLTLTTNDTLDYVAVDIPLPAGLEAVDTSIGKGRRAMVLRGGRGWWVSHTELETERALVFADRLTPGTHHHTVFLRAITPGVYTMPPTKAEAMYYPEIQGNTGPSSVTVAP
ncbi:MAG: alpha-2-macroglobulin, partial [Deltaproteobacteria bacterium]|nr:alpha-2-macroglobulin [Deltaproteobacteria bacterium]